MMGNHYKLYDENLVRNIMMSTGMSIMEFVKDNRTVGPEEVCDFIEFNADNIIAGTIKGMDNNEDGYEYPEENINSSLLDDEDD